MSEWTSINAIMQDLSVAQGHRVPASLKLFGAAKPPTVAIEENTESDYFKSIEDIDFSKPPDLCLIKEMIHMVQHDTETGDVIENSSLDPFTPDFVPQIKKDNNVKDKIKHRKNVAITSILEAQETGKQPELSMSPKSMFKKKSLPVKMNEVVSPEEVKATSKEIDSHKYTPSRLAKEYYNRMLINSKLKEQINEDIDKHKNDIQIKVSQEFKEIEEKKKLASENSPSSRSSSTSESILAKAVDFLNLLHHRHIYLNTPAECVVCNVAAKHGYTFTEEN